MLSCLRPRVGASKGRKPEGSSDDSLAGSSEEDSEGAEGEYEVEDEDEEEEELSSDSEGRTGFLS